MAFRNFSSGGTNTCVALMSSTDGFTFSSPAFLQPFSKSEFPPENCEEPIPAPALTVFNSELFVAWSNVPEKLNFASRAANTNFGNRVEVQTHNPTIKVAASANATNLVIAFPDEPDHMIAVLKSSTGGSVDSITQASSTDISSDDPGTG